MCPTYVERMRRKHIRKALVSFVAISAMASSVTACADGNDGTTGQFGGSITVGIFDNFPGFCVSNNPANSALMATRTIYETLFEKS